ncbi:hypothetical protein PVAG01_10622 [Phlyctema vagabunda]|uniref:Uncharacterized protein n=1 Tax=Phlyctema vagabunda TaxID=108571 RepID=A0ABR4P2U2_9HELO
MGHKDLWPQLEHVLRFERKYNNKDLNAAAEEGGIVANLCTKFNEAGINYPVLTTYESQPTPIRHGVNPLRHNKRVQLVSYDLAETGLRAEKMMLLDLDHRDLRTLQDTSRSTPTREFIASVVDAFKKSKIWQPPTPLQTFGPGILQANLFESTVSEYSQVHGKSSKMLEFSVT